MIRLKNKIFNYYKMNMQSGLIDLIKNILVQDQLPVFLKK